jgi:alginate O-acetyltransferase complex protein AlgI
MLGLLGALLLAPLYWLVPQGRRRAVATGLSLAALGAIDVRLLGLLAAATALVCGVGALLPRIQDARARGVAVTGALGLVVSFFVLHKTGGGAGGQALASQQGLSLLGASYLTLKAAAAILDVARGAAGPLRPGEVLAWLSFLPTYPAGPIEELGHFRDQTPHVDTARVLTGLERILFGLVKALVLGAHLGAWADGIVADPTGHDRLTLLAALYAESLRFYLDFAGYSDVAIGLAAVYGVEIAENFDAPFTRRNYVQLWQRWHMTLTGWLRTYLFVPVSRQLLRRLGPEHHVAAVVAGQLVAMTACGLWHGLSWNFAVWGLLQAVGLIWVGSLARPLGARLPAGLVRWWRESRVAHAVAVALTFTAFSLTIVFAVTDLAGAGRYLALLVG